MIVAPIPILGRKALFPWTCHRLVKMGVVPLCIVESDKDKKVAQYYNLPVKQVRHMPLGKKWNVGFEWARSYNPHAVLYVGSSDWVSDDWLDSLLPYLDEYDMVGIKGIHFLHREYSVPHFARSLKDFTQRLGYWNGYKGDREGESCGGGRLLSRRILDLMEFKPFRDENYNNMDYNMLYKVMNHGGRVKTVEGPVGLSVSCDLWGNMHDFNRDTDKEIKDVKKFLEKHFPEGLELWNVDGVYSQIKSQR